MKIVHQISIIALLILFGAIPAYGNVGLPMLVLALPGMIIGLIPIIMIETWHIQRSLRIPYRRALKAVSIANLESTLLGIPLTWIVWIIVATILGFFGYYIAQGLNISLPDSAGMVFAVTIGAAWLGPTESSLYWMIPTASFVLLIPFFYVSWLLERSMVKRFLKEFSWEEVKMATFTANLYSYGFLGIIVLGWLIVSISRKAST